MSWIVIGQAIAKVDRATGIYAVRCAPIWNPRDPEMPSFPTLESPERANMAHLGSEAASDFWLALASLGPELASPALMLARGDMVLPLGLAQVSALERALADSQQRSAWDRAAYEWVYRWARWAVADCRRPAIERCCQPMR